MVLVKIKFNKRGPVKRDWCALMGFGFCYAYAYGGSRAP